VRARALTNKQSDTRGGFFFFFFFSFSLSRRKFNKGHRTRANFALHQHAKKHISPPNSCWETKRFTSKQTLSYLCSCPDTHTTNTKTRTSHSTPSRLIEYIYTHTHAQKHTQKHAQKHTFIRASEQTRVSREPRNNKKVGVSQEKKNAIPKIILKRRKMNNLLRRIFIAYFATHIPATILIDSQAIVPGRFIPSFAKRLLEFHIKTNDDFLMLEQPLWLKSFIFFEVLVQLPLFCILLRKLSRKEEKNIRLIGCAYSSHVMTTMVPILTEIYHRGSFSLFMIYFPYFFVPLMLLHSLATSEEGNVFRKRRTSARATTKRK